MTKKKIKRVVKMKKGEKLLYFMGVFAFTCTLLLKIFCGANVGNLNMSVEKLRYTLEDQEKKNESLVMKVNELTSYDNVKDIVKDMGLAYNNDNIIVVGD